MQKDQKAREIGSKTKSKEIANAPPPNANQENTAKTLNEKPAKKTNSKKEDFFSQPELKLQTNFNPGKLGTASTKNQHIIKETVVKSKTTFPNKNPQSRFANKLLNKSCATNFIAQNILRVKRDSKQKILAKEKQCLFPQIVRTDCW